MISNRADINRVLADMREIKAQTQLNPAINDHQDKPLNGLKALETISTDNNDSFSQLMSQAVNNVNELQKKSGAMAKAYEQGQAGVDITDVMIASQKASVSFQAMVQVRNKLVEAYRDVMNMPV